VIDRSLFQTCEENGVPDAAVLLASHQARWKRVKSSWKQADFANQSRYTAVLAALQTAKQEPSVNLEMSVSDEETEFKLNDFSDDELSLKGECSIGL
jgi:hypothetical protein